MGYSLNEYINMRALSNKTRRYNNSLYRLFPNTKLPHFSVEALTIG